MKTPTVLIVLDGFGYSEAVEGNAIAAAHTPNWDRYADGKMNLNIEQTGGELLLVPQFTLAADTRSGMRPGFSTAASPETGQRLFTYLVGRAQQGSSRVASGQFGADMQVSLVNDGPVTFWLEVNPRQ